MGGETGEWPDPLIPRIDSYYQERRNAFPFQLAAGHNQSVWVDVYVPTGTRAGAYKGEVTVTQANSGTRLAVSLEMNRESWDERVEEMSRAIAGLAPSISGPGEG